MSSVYVLTTHAVIVEEHCSFTLPSLCHASGARTEQVRALVGEGVLHPTGLDPTDWQFAGDALARTRRALRLARDLELGMAGVALVLDLLVEIDDLRIQLQAHARTPVRTH